MLNKLFKKKEELSDIQKELLKKICLFYETNKELFINNINSQKDKKELVKEIYKRLDYSNYPLLENNQDLFDNSNVKIYRGISGENQDLLDKYVNDFILGEPFYGGRASIYGTGIYTVLGSNLSIAEDYASDGGINNCGIIIESILSDDSKIIESSKIDEIRNIIFKMIRKMYSENIDKYLNILEDDGALSAILGYDAILVEEKNYMVILNRSKLIVNGNLLSNLIVRNENYQRR